MPLLTHSRTSVTYYISFQMDDTFIRCPPHARAISRRPSRARDACARRSRAPRAFERVRLSLVARRASLSVVSRVARDARRPASTNATTIVSKVIRQCATRADMARASLHSRQPDHITSHVLRTRSRGIGVGRKPCISFAEGTYRVLIVLHELIMENYYGRSNLDLVITSGS